MWAGRWRCHSMRKSWVPPLTLLSPILVVVRNSRIVDDWKLDYNNKKFVLHLQCRFTLFCWKNSIANFWSFGCVLYGIQTDREADKIKIGLGVVVKHERGWYSSWLRLWGRRKVKMKQQFDNNGDSDTTLLAAARLNDRKGYVVVWFYKML